MEVRSRSTPRRSEPRSLSSSIAQRPVPADVPSGDRTSSVSRFATGMKRLPSSRGRRSGSTGSSNVSARRPVATPGRRSRKQRPPASSVSTRRGSRPVACSMAHAAKPASSCFVRKASLSTRSNGRAPREPRSFAARSASLPIASRARLDQRSWQGPAAARRFRRLRRSSLVRGRPAPLGSASRIPHATVALWNG